MAEKKKRRKKRRLKKGFVILLVLLIAVAVAAAAVLAVIKFVPDIGIMRVTEITVEGDVPYSEEQVIRASGLTVGVSVLKQSLSVSERSIASSLPYVKEASVTYSLGGKLTVMLTAAEVKYQLKSGSIYYLADESIKLLDTSSKKLDGVPLIYGISLSDTAKIGSVGIEGDDPSLMLARKLEDTAAQYGVKLEVIDVEDSSALSAVYDGRLFVEIGTEEYLDSKLKYFATMLRELDEDETGRVLLKSYTPSNRKVSLLTENISGFTAKY